MPIGLLAFGPQTVLAQDPAAGGTAAWSGRGERIRDRFESLLLAATPDWSAGWQLAVDLGRPAAPMLWDLVADNKSNVKRRLVLMAAAVLAGGNAEDERLLTWLAQPKPMLEERVLAAMLMALGPQRTRPAANFWSRCLGPAKSPEQLLSIAVRLASAKFPEAAEGAPLLLDEDPGVGAAATYAGLPWTAAMVARWSNVRGGERHADLYWRGAMLGAARSSAGPAGQGDPSLEMAREVLRLRDERLTEARATAVWLRASRGDLQPSEARLDWPLLQVAVGDPETAALLNSWLGPAATPRDEAPHRLAVAYALVRPVAEVIAARGQWAGDARIREHIAVALAFRLGKLEQVPTIVEPLPNVAAWQFVQWMSGGRIDRPDAGSDPVLRAALPLLADGRLGRRQLCITLEDTLWRWGSHPGLAVWRLERGLVRDLLLAGSNRGGGKYQPHIPPDQRYFPTGLDRNDEFFAIAVALFDFLQQPRLPLPPELRLPD
ncbi:MAG: hypothetical protein MUC36_15585 [Planctomycetes bacterium]|nr:hypothetical protein [Planctomycetota bacterium]